MKIVVTVKSDIQDRRTRARARIFCRRILTRLLKEREFQFLRRKQELGMGILMASLKTSKRLNRSFRKRNRATNVLSFSLFGSLAELRGAKAGSVELGDLVVAPMVIKHEAARAGRDFYTQFFAMLAHGILHLLGQDHERSLRSRARMETLETKLLGSLEMKTRRG